jgi:putative sporulation protein YyaC
MESTLTVRLGEPTILVTLSSALERALAERDAVGRGVVFACIGTDRSTGDALGPLVGQKLRRLGCTPEEVIGTLEEPLHALNLADRLRPVLESAGRPLVVAVDAALGSSANVGAISARPGGLRPGQGVGKDLPAVGEVSVTGTVNVSAGALDAQILQSTRLFVVQQMADVIGTALWWGLRSVRRHAEARLAETIDLDSRRVVRAA